MKIFRKSSDLLTDEAIGDWLRELRGRPYVPESGFDVTAVIRSRLGSTDGYYFGGVNVENPDHRISTHGEEGSLAAMVTALGIEAEILEVWLMGAPSGLEKGTSDSLAQAGITCCGKCRQQLTNFAGESTPIHSIALNGAISTTALGTLLPNQFTFRQFRPEALSRVPEVPHPPSVEQVERRLVRFEETMSQDAILGWLDSLQSADLATDISDAVVLKLGNGTYVSGVKIEEAAYVDMSAIQCAVAIATGEFGKQDVHEVWSLSRGRGAKGLVEQGFQPLTLSSVQVLLQFAVHSDIPVYLVNGQGDCRPTSLSDSFALAPRFSEPAPGAEQAADGRNFRS